MAFPGKIKKSEKKNEKVEVYSEKPNVKLKRWEIVIANNHVHL